jgi:hypothetical protein
VGIDELSGIPLNKGGIKIMATLGHLTNLKKIAEKFQTLEQDKLLRPTLGEESLETVLKPKLDNLNKRIEFALEYASNVNDNSVSQVVTILNQFYDQLDAQSKRNNAEYVSQRGQFLSTIDSYFEQFLQPWPFFVTAAIEKRGFLQDEGIRKEYERTIEAIKKESTNSLNLVKEEAEKTIEEAKKLAQQIEDRARKTAAHISVEAAQEQFKLAQEDIKKQVRLWAILSILSIIAFIVTAILLARITLPEEWKWHVIYYTAIRITILTAVGAVATFCLRILRAHLHMSQHNLHRQRLANSMAAFVESAVTPEQRDLILAHLVDAVAAFGHSGLLHKEDDSIYAPKMTIDSITRTLTSPSQKS